ncbi:MAG TPA: lipid A export permease/ATP-binding protein MsbA [Methylibium sp.]|uniref:lipid A export permease/ATP-binding protein MsbA n=1 Tax=Methylibium sp. TaxID=2067992 RepID=UPI002DB5A336|nr:lipid A export permease/ATP-binding protein MsbA [Methylibium sp.]HEU4458443.1 lipid A export permease/ATP-binding protein MsbA [Methylibium sp.]
MNETVPMPTRSVRERLRELAPYFRPTRWAFAAAFGGAAISAATETGIAALMKPLIDRGFVPGGFPLWVVPAVIIGLFLVRGLAGFVINYALAWASNDATLAMRRAMFARLLGSHPSVMTQQTSSSLINTVVYELQTGTTLLVGATQTLLKDSLTVVGLLGYMLWMNWQLTLLIALLFPTVAWVMRVFGKRMHAVTVAGQKATDALAYVVEENVLAWRLVRLHDAGDAQLGRFEQASRKLRQLLMKATVAASSVTPITQLLSACALATVVVVALWQSRNDGGTVGSFFSYVAAMLAMITPLKHLADVAGPVTRGLAAVERGLTLAHTAPVETGGTHTAQRAAGRIELRDVGVSYRADQTALAGVDLVVQPGEALALVGPSGAGKSTLINLLPRFFDPTSGQLVLDGVPLPEWDLASLRSQFALVSQDVVLFNDSVAANVAFGEAEGGAIDRERVVAALQGANLLGFVESLPQGMDTPVGHNGSQLSGGQRQRLAIARAIYKDAPILLLDEATSALDSESERLVQSALARLMSGRTSIVIAHRLSTVESVDRIAVLDHGRVVELGTHAELLARGGLFKRLHALQFHQ